MAENVRVFLVSLVLLLIAGFVVRVWGIGDYHLLQTFCWVGLGAMIVILVLLGMIGRRGPAPGRSHRLRKRSPTSFRPSQPSFLHSSDYPGYHEHLDHLDHEHGDYEHGDHD